MDVWVIFSGWDMYSFLVDSGGISKRECKQRLKALANLAQSGRSEGDMLIPKTLAEEQRKAPAARLQRGIRAADKQIFKQVLCLYERFWHL